MRGGSKAFLNVALPPPKSCAKQSMQSMHVGFWSSNGWCFICQVGFQGEKSVESKTRVSCVAIFSGGYFCISVISVRQINWKKNKFKSPQKYRYFLKVENSFFLPHCIATKMIRRLIYLQSDLMPFQSTMFSSTCKAKQLAQILNFFISNNRQTPTSHIGHREMTERHELQITM